MAPSKAPPPRAPRTGAPAAPLLRPLILLGSLGAVLLLGLALRLALGWTDRAPVEGWMTPRLIMLTHGLSEDDLVALLGADAMAPSRTLNRIAAETGRDAAELVGLLEAAASARRAADG